jgi:hypothetical protein
MVNGWSLSLAGQCCDSPNRGISGPESAVLVRLSRVTPDVLRDLLGMAHKFVTAHRARRSPTRNRRKRI